MTAIAIGTGSVFQGPCSAIDVLRATDRCAWMLNRVQHDEDLG